MKMKNLNKTFIQVMVILVVFSLVFPTNTYGKKVKRGTNIVVTKIDGSMVEGELLSVKQNSILLMTHSGVNGNKINVNEIQKIMIKKRSKIGKGMGKGFLYGALIGGLIGIAGGSGEGSDVKTFNGFILGLIGGGGGAILGGLFGAAAGVDITENLEGGSPEEISLILDNLKKYARFKE